MWRDLAWVLDMLQASRKALEYAHGLSEEQFGGSNLHQDDILRQLTIGRRGRKTRVCGISSQSPRSSMATSRWVPRCRRARLFPNRPGGGLADRPGGFTRINNTT